jgi:hypothetical protein
MRASDGRVRCPEFRRRVSNGVVKHILGRMASVLILGIQPSGGIRTQAGFLGQTCRHLRQATCHIHREPAMRLSRKALSSWLLLAATLAAALAWKHEVDKRSDLKAARNQLEEMLAAHHLRNLPRTARGRVDIECKVAGCSLCDAVAWFSDSERITEQWRLGSPGLVAAESLAHLQTDPRGWTKYVLPTSNGESVRVDVQSRDAKGRVSVQIQIAWNGCEYCRTTRAEPRHFRDCYQGK